MCPAFARTLTGVFWDVEDFPIPPDQDFHSFPQKVEEALYREGCFGDLSVMAYGRPHPIIVDDHFRSARISIKFQGDEKRARLSHMLHDMIEWATSERKIQYEKKIYTNFDGKGTYLVFNVGDAIFICDQNSQNKDPVKSINFSNSNPMCHAFDPDAKDGHDLLIGLNSGDVYTVSLRQQLQDVSKKLVGALHYNKDGSVNNSRCTSIAWVPGGDGAFVVAHADGNLYVDEKNKDGAADSTFPAIRNPTQFSVAKAKYSKSNPIARWHICQGSINSIAFSNDGVHLATVGRDGYLRIFEFSTQKLVCGGKSCYGALLCCSWSLDGKFILSGGEDDLVQVWCMEDRKVVAWGEGHSSWIRFLISVIGVAFDSYWSSPNSDGSREHLMHRFGSVGQDTQLPFSYLDMDEIVVTPRRAREGFLIYITGSQSDHWDNVIPMGTLLPAPCKRDVPKLSPVIAHCVHTEPLSGLLFTQESVVMARREGYITSMAPSSKRLEDI